MYSLVSPTDDSAGLSMQPGAFYVWESEGASGSLALASQPTSAVTVTLNSTNTSMGTVQPSSLVFGVGQWDTRWAFGVTAVDDGVFDGYPHAAACVHITLCVRQNCLSNAWYTHDVLALQESD
jgi:hypothetical protein